MTEENVVQLPTLLERLASKLTGYLKRQAANQEEWVEIQEGICLVLVEARDEFKADIDFGEWCEASGLALNRDTRAAAIAMGRDPTALHACLMVTESRSLEVIYRKEFDRFRNVPKPTSRRKKPSIAKPASPQFKKAVDAVDTLQAKGQPVTPRTVAKEAGVSETPARIAVAYKSGEDAKPLTKAEMDAAFQKRFDLAVKKAVWEARGEIEAEVYKEMNAAYQRHKSDYEWASKLRASSKGVMPKETFRKIKACLHPDHNTFKYAAEALQAFSELEDVLVKPDPPTFSGPPLPATVADLMAQRRTRR